MSTNLRFLRYAHALLGTLLGGFLLFAAINTYLVTLYRTDGNSMFPTIHDGQVLGVSLSEYSLYEPKVNDIVILTYAGDSNISFIKRIVAGPGQITEYQGQSITLGEDQYFVVGDNRDHSTDSRAYGPIHRSQIIGRVFTAR